MTGVSGQITRDRQEGKGAVFLLRAKHRAGGQYRLAGEGCAGVLWRQPGRRRPGLRRCARRADGRRSVPGWSCSELRRGASSEALGLAGTSSRAGLQAQGSKAACSHCARVWCLRGRPEDSRGLARFCLSGAWGGLVACSAEYRAAPLPGDKAGTACAACSTASGYDRAEGLRSRRHWIRKAAMSVFRKEPAVCTAYKLHCRGLPLGCSVLQSGRHAAFRVRPQAVVTAGSGCVPVAGSGRRALVCWGRGVAGDARPARRKRRPCLLGQRASFF